MSKDKMHKAAQLFWKLKKSDNQFLKLIICKQVLSIFYICEDWVKGIIKKLNKLKFNDYWLS